MNEAEQVWIAQAVQGDDSAFTQLVEAYQSPVFNLCYRMLGDPDEAEDAAQEAFIRAYRALRGYDPTRPFATWLLSIASHHCIDRIRKRRMKLVSFDSLPAEGELVADPLPTPETRFRQTEDQQQMQELLDSLAPVDRSAVVMYYWYDYSYEEIAQALSLSLSAVKSRLHRARRQLAETWQKSHQTHSIKVERKRHESPAF